MSNNNQQQNQPQSQRTPNLRGRRGGPMMGPVEKAKDFRGTLKQLLNYLKPFRVQIAISLVFAVAGTIMSVIAPAVLGSAVTVAFDGSMARVAGTGGVNFDQLITIMTLLGALYVFSFVFAGLQGVIIAGVSQKVSYNLRNKFYAKINHMPLKYFDNIPHGDVLSRMTNDIDLMADSLGQSMTQLITSIITLVGAIIMMLTISVTMTGVALLILPLSLVIVAVVVKYSQKFFRAQQKYLGAVNGQIEEVFSGHLIVKAYNAEGRVAKNFHKDNNVLYNAAWKAQFVSALIFPMMFFVGNVGYVAVSVFGAYLAIQGTLAVGAILAFIQYSRRISDPINMLAQISNVLQSTVAAAERVFEFLGEKEETPDAQNATSTADIVGKVGFKDVKFGYIEDTPVIHNFSAHIGKGQRTAIVGPTGAGKTTIVKLLMRYYDIDEGQILLDGHDIRDFARDDLRGVFAMVLQETWLFNGTIMENIRYGRLTATDEEVIEAAKAAHAHHFIMTQPGGYDLIINEEANNISQGQKQLLTIARAILADPRILILDEATSSVDTRTEQLIQKAMDNLMHDRTSFIIAHRLSTIRHADLILVMNGGDITEQGTHKELLEQKGFYHELYTAQFEA
ncbi:MAG: ABC transporter ATP-binding protein/permease [Defluviitaleaceae bacterium]|nr:ABC transporter ATP-binding protein/permease [Defluviitaleaceae bacterium]